jgi:hypothetical protein
MDFFTVPTFTGSVLIVLALGGYVWRPLSRRPSVVGFTVHRGQA